MPIMKLCNYPYGCKDYALEGDTRCAKHKRPKRKPFENAVRANTMLYNTARWRELKKIVIEQEVCCRMCGKESELTVDHIIAPRGDEQLFYDRNNLQCLCKDCHRIKTAKEIEERKR